MIKFLRKLFGMAERGQWEKHNVLMDIHFLGNDNAWKDFQEEYGDKFEGRRICGTGPAYETSYETFKMYVPGIAIDIFGPHFPNPDYSEDVARVALEQRKEREENPCFDILKPYVYHEQYLNKVHFIVEEELRRRKEVETKRNETL